MGLFDSFDFKTKCPYCKKIKEFDFQTKKLWSGMYHFEVGQEVSSFYYKAKDGIIPNAIASDNCRKSKGKCFFGQIIIKGGKFKGIQKITKRELQEKT